MTTTARWIVVGAAVAAAGGLSGCTDGLDGGGSQPVAPRWRLYDFTGDDAPSTWKVVTDGVMGGKSTASFQREQGGAVLAGTVSLENFGGFAAARAPFEKRDLKRYDGLAVRVRGDGKKYRLYLKTTAADDGLMYWAPFAPPAGEWTTVHLPFAKFSPHLRGVPLLLLAAANDQPVHSVGLLIADRQEGPFRIEIASIAAYREAPDGESPAASRPEE